MKLLCLLALVAAVSAETTETSNENQDTLESVLQDLTDLKAFMDCLNDKGPCGDSLVEFQKALLDAIEEDCAKCTPTQKVQLKEALDRMRQDLPSDYESFKKKYDPETSKLPALLKSLGIE